MPVNTISSEYSEEVEMMLRVLKNKDSCIDVLVHAVSIAKEKIDHTGALAQGEVAQEYAEAVSALQSHVQVYEIMINDRIFSSRYIVQLLLS
jgi:ABC-type phosphate/phosphonate transport system ATPase subunit